MEREKPHAEGKESIVSKNPLLIYLDTNVYARPFDDQNQASIQAEADAVVKILDAVKAGKLHLLSSDILLFEVHNILDDEKCTKVLTSLTLCTQHIEQSDELLRLGKSIQQHCHTRARDALHVASAIIGQARYCLSCDNTVTHMKNARCYRRMGKSFRQKYFSVMNPIRFVKQLDKEELS